MRVRLTGSTREKMPFLPPSLPPSLYLPAAADPAPCKMRLQVQPAMVEERPKPMVAAPRVRRPTRRRFFRPSRRMAWREGGREGEGEGGGGGMLRTVRREGGREGERTCTILTMGQMMRLVRGKTAKMRPTTVLLVPVRALAS